MKKFIQFIILTTLLITVFSIPCYAADNTINNVSINVDKATNKVTVQGSTSSGSGKSITIQSIDPEGSLDYIDQTLSTTSGTFSFVFTPSNIMNGNYDVKLGGDGVASPYSQQYTFNQTPAPAPPSSQTDTPAASGAASATGSSSFSNQVSNTANSSSQISSNASNSASTQKNSMPKTGTRFDFTTLITLGILSIIAGLAITIYMNLKWNLNRN